MAKSGRIGKRGTVVIPVEYRRQLGLEEGALVLFEGAPDGVKIRPAVAVPVEIYTPQRKAAFLLENAIGDKDYARALREVKKLGLDPAKIPHERP